MSKSVLISIQPKWCELIASGKKTVEVRKSKPTLDVPFKVYIYCTKPRNYYKISKHLLTSDESLFFINGKVRMCDGFGVEYEDSEYKHLNRKVIGEFVCNGIDRMVHCGTCNNDIHLRIVDENLYCKELDAEYLSKCNLSYSDIDKYSNGGDVYGWHISNLIIYDKPKELSEFYRKCDEGCEACAFWKKMRVNADELDMDCSSPIYGHIPITRPPQSWCYVEDMKGAK